VGSHRVFGFFWWATNALLAFALLATLFTGISEHSVRQYLSGFSDAIIPEGSSPEQKAHEVCGSATSAFLNLSPRSGLEARRLLLLSQDRTAKHVVAEVQTGGRWVIVDATYRAFMKDSQARLLTRADLQDPRMFQEAIAQIPGYTAMYSYERVAHVRVGALPVLGPFLRRALDTALSGWDESLDWSLLLERSFAFFFLSVWALTFFFLLRIVLAWIADHRLRIPRLHRRTSLSRATATFFSTPEMK
jgi:hypothetical protein